MVPHRSSKSRLFTTDFMIWPIFLCSLILAAFNNYLLSTYVLGTVLGTSDTMGRYMGEEQGKFRFWEGNLELTLKRIGI